VKLYGIVVIAHEEAELCCDQFYSDPGLRLDRLVRAVADHCHAVAPDISGNVQATIDELLTCEDDELSEAARRYGTLCDPLAPEAVRRAEVVAAWAENQGWWFTAYLTEDDSDKVVIL